MNKNFLHNVFALNWSATVGINYAIGGLSNVFRMPVKVYGKLKWHIGGEIVLPVNAKRNTLIIGSSHEDYKMSSGKAELNISGNWEVKGIVRIGPDCFVGVKDGCTLIMGDGCMIGRNTQIHCSDRVEMGRDVIAGEIYVTDSSEHQIVLNGEKKPMTAPIYVGDGTYFGFRCMLLKGCHIPPRSVVASGSICTRDYTKEGAENLFIAGVPAVVKGRNTFAIK